MIEDFLLYVNLTSFMAKIKEIENIAEIIKQGGVGILPTDTIYGFVGLALNKKAVAKIFALKKRKHTKPLIVLISSLEDLDKLAIKVNPTLKTFLNSIWPGPVSVVLPCSKKQLSYLHLGKNLAVRWPNNKFLIDLIKISGPLVAPSANPENIPPAKNIKMAKKYFPEVDFYISSKKMLSDQPSTLIDATNNKIVILREGKGINKCKKALKNSEKKF